MSGEVQAGRSSAWGSPGSVLMRREVQEGRSSAWGSPGRASRGRPDYGKDFQSSSSAALIEVSDRLTWSLHSASQVERGGNCLFACLSPMDLRVRNTGKVQNIVFSHWMMSCPLGYVERGKALLAANGLTDQRGM